MCLCLNLSSSCESLSFSPHFSLFCCPSLCHRKVLLEMILRPFGSVDLGERERDPLEREEKETQGERDTQSTFSSSSDAQSIQRSVGGEGEKNTSGKHGDGGEKDGDETSSLSESLSVHSGEGGGATPVPALPFLSSPACDSLPLAPLEILVKNNLALSPPIPPPASSSSESPLPAPVTPPLSLSLSVPETTIATQHHLAGSRVTDFGSLSLSSAPAESRDLLLSSSLSAAPSSSSSYHSSSNTMSRPPGHKRGMSWKERLSSSLSLNRPPSLPLSTRVSLSQSSNLPHTSSAISPSASPALPTALAPAEVRVCQSLSLSFFF